MPLELGTLESSVAATGWKTVEPRPLDLAAELFKKKGANRVATKFRKLSVLCFLLTVATAAAAADVAPPFKMSSADLDRAVATGTLAVGEGGPKVLVVRRTITGEVEVHDRLNDIFVIRSGRATVTVGGTVSGNRLTMPGEWRGGTISGGQSFALKPGDLLWIPAGLPHKVIVPPGREFKYLAFKSAR